MGATRTRKPGESSAGCGRRVREAVGLAARGTLTACPAQSHPMAGFKTISGATKSVVAAALVSLLLVGSLGTAGAVGDLRGSTATLSRGRSNEFLVAQRRSCTAVTTREEAVEMWCRGYQRAGADRDGIPCENIRRSKSQVDKIKEEIGC
jgi:hypothetical protein